MRNNTSTPLRAHIAYLLGNQNLIIRNRTYIQNVAEVKAQVKQKQIRPADTREEMNKKLSQKCLGEGLARSFTLILCV